MSTRRKGRGTHRAGGVILALALLAVAAGVLAPQPALAATDPPACSGALVFPKCTPESPTPPDELDEFKTGDGYDYGDSAYRIPISLPVPASAPCDGYDHPPCFHSSYKLQYWNEEFQEWDYYGALNHEDGPNDTAAGYIELRTRDTREWPLVLLTIHLYWVTTGSGGDQGHFLTLYQTVDLRNTSATPPSVGITWAASGTPGTFQFSGNAAATSPATITRYDWDFGDGDVRSDAGPSPTKHWDGEAATRTVGLTVTDSKGRTNSTTARLKPELDITEAPTEPDAVHVGDESSLQITVANDGPSTIRGVTPDFAIGPAAKADRTIPIAPASVDLAPGDTATFNAPFNAKAEGDVAGTIDATGTAAGVAVHATQREFTFTIGNPGLLIDLDGQIVEVGKSFALLMTIKNSGVDPVTDIAFDVPAGIKVESGDNPPSATPSVSYVRGPDEPLPLTLAPGAEVTRSYIFNAPEVGASVLTASAKGKVGDTVVNGRRALSVLVVAGWSAGVRDQLAAQGVENALTGLVEGSGNLSTQQIVAALGYGQPSAQRVLAAKSSGITNPQLQRMVAATSNADDPGLVRDVLSSWGEGFALSMDEAGQSGGQALVGLENLFWAVQDPVQRKAIAGKVVESAKGLGAGTLQNAGYLGKALLATPTVDGLQTIYADNAAAAGAVKDAMAETAIGTPQVIADYHQQAQTDPRAALRDFSKWSGGLFWTGSEAGMSTALGEAGTAVALKAVTPVAAKTLGAFRKGGAVVVDEATALAGEGVAATDASEAMVERMAQAAAVVEDYQTLPENTVLDAAAVTGKAGLLREDAAQIQDSIKLAKDTLGVDLEVSVRTSEPLSAGIEGIAKPEVIKPKAVSILDQMMGGPPARAGKVTIFKPTPIPAETLAQLEASNPGFLAKYTDRFAKQDKLWKEWKDGGSKLEKLTTAAREYATGETPRPITMLLDRPGNLVPNGAVYLEQFSEDAFLAAKGLTREQGAAIQQEIMANRNIDKFVGSPVATVGSDGSIAIDDLLKKVPYLSDADIHGINILGPLPKGVTKGQVETFMKAQFKKIKRFPFHGWSDAAVDLPSDFYMAAVPFQLGNANPVTALASANKIASRLQLLENLARAKAAKLIAAGDTAGAAKVLKRFEFGGDLANLKDPVTGLYSGKKLLAKFPPGEKTINFTAGDVRVGYGNGGN